MSSPVPTTTAPNPTPSRRPQMLGALALLLASLGATAAWSYDAMMTARAVNESRTMANLAENVGKWASQYGGIHARTVGADARFPGNFLTRSVYTAAQADAVTSTVTEREALQRMEAYHWKNPALVQREVADVIASSGNPARYRLTARTVLNTDNAPNAFDVEALDAIQSGDGTRTEYWRPHQGELLYARAVIAQKSCLRCHDTPEKAPDFLKTNAKFNGGGGFGYVEGKPAALISVRVPMPRLATTLGQDMPAQVWAALAIALAALGWLVTSVLSSARARR